MSSGVAPDPALVSCPDSPIAADIFLDASGSSGSSPTMSDRIAIIEDVAHRTALCGGRLRISAFSSSSGATSTLLDEELEVEGATDQAKARRVDGVVAGVIATVESSYAAAVASLPTDGSDITSVLRLTSEYAAQLPGFQLDSYVLTDGLSNVGINLEQSLTAQQATDLASTVAVPDLSDAWLTIAGLGRVDDNPTSSSQTEALVAFYSTLCQRSGAATCTVVTDFAKRW